MITGPGKEERGARHRGRRGEAGPAGLWDSICVNCGRYIKGITGRRPYLWQRVLPYCRNCRRYALRPVHGAAVAAALISLIAAALYLLLG